MKKKTLSIRSTRQQHWVGDGFPVRTMFSYNELGRELSPFLMMDYAGPTEFPPKAAGADTRGVGEHPHRGFETVTIVYSGEVEHRDSAGGGGLIGPGDVQWMTAASGLVHEEKHGRAFAEKGGAFEMIQLWVNLPAKDKKHAPRYQGLLSAEIPQIALSGPGGSVRVIAGEYAGRRGPAQTFTPMHVWDVQLARGQRLELPTTEGYTASVFVQRGSVRIEDGETVGAAELAVFDRQGDIVIIEAEEETRLLFLSGEPINEPIVGYGPFVMNTPEEIRQAFLDYQAGRMGHLSPAAH